MANKKADIFYDCPGAWRGNSPGSFESNPRIGNMVIDPKLTVQALAFLRRRAEIVSTDLSPQGDGLLIIYRKF